MSLTISQLGNMGEIKYIKPPTTQSWRWCILCAPWLGQEPEGTGKGGGNLTSVWPLGVWLKISRLDLYIQDPPKKRGGDLSSALMWSVQPFRWARRT